MSCGLIRFLLPPSAVQAAVYCNFFNKREKCLVVAGLNFVQVFRLNVVQTVQPGFEQSEQVDDAMDGSSLQSTEKQVYIQPAVLDDDDDDDDLYGPSTTKSVPLPTVASVQTTVAEKAAPALVSPEDVRLECVATYELFGTITDLKASALQNSNRDLLLISFTDAKLSVVQYDPIVNDLRSISLHDYEAARFSDEMLTNLGQAQPRICVDPVGRCGVMRLYRTQLMVVPFVQPPLRSDNSLNGPKPVTQFKSFALSLRHMKDETAEFIQDIQMLPGYLEPTVAVLIHKTLSCAGRVAVSSDTCYVAALSINTREKSYHLIWSCSGLPFDCQYLRNVPQPIGGLLVFSTNSMIYVQQGVQAHGVSLNSMAVGSVRFALKPVPHLVTVLDGSQCAFFEPERMLLTLRNGNAYVVTVVYDSVTRTIRDFHWQPVLVNRYASCVTALEGGYVFVGGKMSDSVLYTYMASPWIEAEGAPADGDFPSYHANPPRTLLRRPGLLDGVDEDDIYGPQAFTAVVTALKKYRFVPCDSIISVGPCRTSAVGEPVNTLEDFTRTPDKDADLITSSGYENDSYVCAMHRSIRPDVVASFDLHGAEDIWTLRRSAASFHEYVVVTTVGRTAVFQSGEEISEDIEHPFRVDEQTLFCCLTNDGQTAVQVTRFHIRVSTAEGANVTELVLQESEEVAYATEGGNRLAVLTTLGKLWLFRWDGATDSLQEMPSDLSGIVAVSFFTDRSGIFTSSCPPNVGTVDMEFEPEKPELQRMESQPEDEDELLYASHTDKAEVHKEKHARTQDEFHRFLYDERVNVMPFGFSDWLLVVRADSAMSILSLPGLIVMFETNSILHAPRVIHDARALDQPSVPPEMIETACPDIHIKEVLLLGLGTRQAQPYLFIVVNEDIHIYHAVPYYYGRDESRLRICFSKVKHDMLTRERRLKKQRLHKDELVDDRLAKRHLRPFQNVRGYSGVFLCFPYSFFVMTTDRNILRFHPMVVDGPIKAFAEFSNANCTSGFIYYNSRKQIRVAALETSWNYDFTWPIAKVRVPGTIHYLSYHLECKAYVVCTSTFYPEKRMIHGDVDQVQEEIEERDPRFVFPLMPRFALNLVTPDEWQLVPEAMLQFPDFEHITAMKVLPLRNGTETGMKEYVVLGSNMSYGEDVQSRGRLIIIEILDLVPEPDKPLARFKLKEIYAEEQKGPVTAICGVNGYIVSAIGQKVFIWALKGSTVVGVAFLDVQIYVHQLTSIKDLILVADIQRSVSLLRFQEKYRTLSLVASDPNQMHTYAADFCVDNQSLTVAVTDVRQDFQIFQFDPNYYFSSFGNRLVRRMECNLGQYVTQMFRFRASAWFPDAERVGHVALTKKHVTMFVTLEGAVGGFVNIPEKTYRRVLMIETILSNHCVHRAGLSPRLYWNAKTSADERFDLVGSIKTVADGKVASLFMELDYTEQYEVAAKIGCAVDTLIEELLDIDRYFLLEVQPDSPRHLPQIHQGEVHAAIMKALKLLHGEQGVVAQLGDIRVKYLNPETGIIFLRARRGPHTLVKDAVQSVTRIGSHVAKLNIVHLSGTMRSSQKRLLEYHRQSLMKMLAHCHTERDREKIRQAMGGLLSVSGKPAMTEAMDISD